MNSLWVARDDDGWCCISVSQEQPKLNKKTGMFSAGGRTWSMGYSFGESLSLKPGECRRLVMESEVSE